MRIRVKVELLGEFRDYVGNKKVVEVEVEAGSKIIEVLEKVSKKLVERVVETARKDAFEGGSVIILKGGTGSTIDASVNDGDTISILPTISGG